MTKHKDKEFKAFVMFVGAEPERLAKWAKEEKAPDVALTLLSGPDDKTLKDYQVNPKVKTTVMVYKDRKLTASFADPKLPKDADAITKAFEAVSK